MLDIHILVSNMLTPIILSKKGFDSTYGRMPSPILSDGRMLSLPIPRKDVSCYFYDELLHDQETYSDILTRLRCRHVSGVQVTHLEPDLVPGARNRPEGWRGMFGQVDQAESHLRNQGVGPGALFLFWGWFAQYDVSSGRYAGNGFSAIYGYLEVDEVIRIDGGRLPTYVRDHPHAAPEYPKTANSIYLARQRLSWNSNRPGWGVFRFRKELRLSQPNGLRSYWRLPLCFHPENGCTVSYNTKAEKWLRDKEYAYVTLPQRGQEFVCTPTHSVVAWARSLIDESDVWTSSEY